MKTAAEEYVHIVLAVGEHDADYVEAYYGPPEWRRRAQENKVPLETLRSRVQAVLGQLAGIDAPSAELERLRHRYLQKQLAAVAARIDMLSGRQFSFDDESHLLYDAVSPHHNESHYQRLIDDIDRELPGNGPTSERIEEFRRHFIIPPDRLDSVFKEALRACRERVLRHLTLPPGESFSIEYVSDKPWSGYNWYKGGFVSLIHVNTDLPVFIDRAV
jgi:hypothetical protein